MVMAGCSETETFSDGVRLATVSANMEESGQTRSLAEDGGGFVWSKGDAIAVYTSSGSFREFTMNQEGGSSSATFSGAYIGGETSSKCAVYPYNESHTVSGNTLSYNLPAVYGSFNTDYTPNTNAPMVARFDDGSSSFTFCHIGGVFKFTFNNVPKDAAQFVFTAKDKDITGSYDVDLSSGESPYIAAKEKGTANSVTINFKPLTAVQNDMVVYVPLPTGTYTGFTLAFNKQDGTELVSFNSNGTNTLDRKDLIKFPALQFEDVDGSMEGDGEEHEYVDLGLSSGTLWATCNVGASKPEDYGSYFAWGETTPKTEYEWSTYKYGSDYNELTKYCTKDSYGIVDNKTVLEASDDAATANWGSGWRMPTTEEQQELCDNCTWTWTTLNGVNGYKVVAENSNSIFLPAAGYRSATSLGAAGSDGYYWSSSLYTSSGIACYLFFRSPSYYWYYSSRYFGRSVRPVRASAQN